MTSIYHLPPELLLNIASHFLGLWRNRDLANLSLVNRAFRLVAQEHLLIQPCFSLTYIHDYLWELGHRPNLIPKIERLEIRSSSRKRMERDESGYVIHKYPAVPIPEKLIQRKEFRAKCYSIINFYAKNKLQEWKWSQAMDNDIVQALLGVLLCILPNLRELYLANAWLVDFPIFGEILTPEAQRMGMVSLLRHHYFLSGAFDVISPKLEILELPANMDMIRFYRITRAIFDCRSFTKLKCLSVTMRALLWYKRPWSPPADPSAIFPPTLECLRISDCTQMTANFINELCLAKKKGRFPHLRYMELYHQQNRADTEAEAEDDRCPSPVHDVRRMCKDAEIALYLYFPGFRFSTGVIGETPWSLREAGLLQECEQYVLGKATWTWISGRKGWLKPNFELSVDGQGDVEMG